MGKNSPWWLALIQGLVALGIGLFMLLDPTAAIAVLGLLAAIYLLVAGIVHTIRGLARRRAVKRMNVMLIRGIVGLVVGVLTYDAWSQPDTEPVTTTTVVTRNDSERRPLRAHTGALSVSAAPVARPIGQPRAYDCTRSTASRFASPR